MILISYELDSKILHYKTKRQKYDFFHIDSIGKVIKNMHIDSSGKVIKNMHIDSSGKVIKNMRRKIEKALFAA